MSALMGNLDLRLITSALVSYPDLYLQVLTPSYITPGAVGNLTCH